jgi:hypothetical protein
VHRFSEPLAVVTSAAELLLSPSQAQHEALGDGGDGAVPLHPHPTPPLDLIAASSTQQALTPAGAGPPQHPPAGVFRESFEFGVVLMVIPPVASSRPATNTDGDCRRWTHAGWPAASSCVLSTDGPSLQAEGQSSEEEFDDRHSRVINLSTDKAAVFREAFRALAPGGRLTISDIVAIREIPQGVRNDLEAYAGCVSGAALVPEVEAMLGAAGFADIRVELKSNSASLVQGWSPGAETFVASALIRARKPAKLVT